MLQTIVTKQVVWAPLYFLFPAGELTLRVAPEQGQDRLVASDNSQEPQASPLSHEATGAVRFWGPQPRSLRSEECVFLGGKAVSDSL